MPSYNDALDDHGQPLNRAFHAKRLKDRGLDELLGICTGLISDGAVNDQEAKFLQEWLNRRPEVQEEHVGYLIYSRLYEFLRDGVLDDEEKRDLFDLLAATCGHTPQAPEIVLSACTFFDTPPPSLQIDCRSFCLTGRFAFGSRRDVGGEIRNLGGWTHKLPTEETDYLVVGTLANRDWKHQSYGNKIDRAKQLRDSFARIRIISEDWWAKHLFS